MANLDGVGISNGQVGANTLNASDGISAIIIACAATDTTVHGEVKTLFNSVDVASAGFTAAFDATNNVNATRHLKEFYRMAGEGQKLYVMLVPAATTIAEILEDADKAKQLLIAAKGEVRQLAIAVNPVGEIVPLNGLPDDVYNSIPKAQALADWAYNNHFPLNIVLEGYSYTGAAAAAADLRAIENVAAPKVSIVIGQDYDHADTKTDNARKFADVGTALGTVSKARVEQNIGDNEDFNLTSATLGTWLTPGLSSHQKIEEVFSDLQTLENKGYIFGFVYSGMEGVRWNNDHVCVEIIEDAEGNINQHTIAYGRTHDKSIRLLRTALLPKVKKSYPVDPATGKLPVGVLKYFKGLGDEVYAGMVRRKEISAGEMFVDPNSDLVTEKVLKTSYVIVPYGTIGEITGTSNLRTNIA
ncbi:hypothetical protein FUA48_16100 [Flavobacterium alkalisoli]|uniref:DUF2586 family protein n=1 Tax=Flavobacterium alkalisoli TaxID=2602769 RepID=A0A5B9FUP5_9FLAO|nr:DUF2586 family protein [Flavobacterium alkalisoli]QEE51043.1 hypothetical protein FUA48_16100 [Flavobacterium alkalisoli]